MIEVGPVVDTDSCKKNSKHMVAAIMPAICPITPSLSCVGLNVWSYTSESAYVKNENSKWITYMAGALGAKRTPKLQRYRFEPRTSRSTGELVATAPVLTAGIVSEKSWVMLGNQELDYGAEAQRHRLWSHSQLATEFWEDTSHTSKVLRNKIGNGSGFTSQ